MSKDLRESGVEALFTSYECESAGLSPTILLFNVSSQKVGRRVEHHLWKRDRCSQKEGLLSSHRRCSTDVPRVGAEPRRLRLESL